MNQIIYIPPLDDTLRVCLQAAVNSKTKPLDALSRFESLTAQIGLIRDTDTPQLMRFMTVVFAADHDITHAGVSAYPQAMTAQTALNLTAGGVAVNVFCRQYGFALEVVNVGVTAPLWAVDAPDPVDAPVGPGIRSLADESVEQAAVITEERDRVVALNAQCVAHHAALGTNVIAPDKMGIADMASAACLMARLCNSPVAQCVGRGTGLDDDGLAHKRVVLKVAMARYADVRELLDMLARFGGPEVAVTVGAAFEAAQRRMVILIDRFITTAAVLAVAHVALDVLRFCAFGYVSDEREYRASLELLDARLLLLLSLRLGEGSGAVLAYPMVVLAVAFLREMVISASVGVSERASP